MKKEEEKQIEEVYVPTHITEIIKHQDEYLKQLKISNESYLEGAIYSWLAYANYDTKGWRFNTDKTKLIRIKEK